MAISIESDPVSPPQRDTVEAVSSEHGDVPAIVSISDIHGYLDDAREALLTLEDHSDFAPIVTADNDGLVHWADENYILVFNGDLVDRGPHNEDVLAMVSRLIEEAPPGRVRVTLGNHEWMIMFPNKFKYADWFSTTLSEGERLAYLEWITDGHVVAAYDGHSVTYAHAGATESYDVSAFNESLIEAANELQAALGTLEDSELQSKLPEQYPQILGTGDRGPKGPGAGLVWVKFDHLPTDAPPQVVGHTRQTKPKTKGNVHCQDLILNNRDSQGGHGIFVETPESLVALIRDSNHGVNTISLA